MNKKSQKFVLSLVIFLVAIIGTFYQKKDEVKNINKREEVVNTINYDHDLSVYFIDVGQADCILVKDNDEYALIDAGNNEDGMKLVNYFKSLNITNFKYVFGTHAHEDHIGGMDNIIDNFNIENFYMPNAITTTKTFEDVLDSLDRKKIKFQTPNVNDDFKLNNATFKVLHIGDNKKDLNDTSVVLRLEYGNTSYLLMGDATSNVEKDLLNNNINLKSDVLKVGHHGSNYSSTIDFLNKVKPEYAIIEVGKNNSYNHPRQETLNKLKDLNAKVYRTDLDGTIVATSDGNSIKIETIKTDTNG
jgi:competence protein ComEC